MSKFRTPTGFVRFMLTMLLACAAFLAGCGGDDTAAVAPPPSHAAMTGHVHVAGGWTPVAGAHVSAAGVSADTDSTGAFTLTDVVPADRVVVKVTATGYGEGFSVAAMGATGASLDVSLIPTGLKSTPFAAATATTLAVPGSTAQVALAANSLQGPSGAAITGNVTVQITPIDPLRDASSMPGDYTTSVDSHLESFGALQVVITDDSGARLNLKPGSTATIRIPVPPTSATLPTTIPLYSFDESSGKWVEEGSASLGGSGVARYYEGSVPHFSTWNADLASDTVRVHGCVVDSTGAPAVGPDHVTVVAAGQDYSAQTSDQADLHAGEFNLAIKAGGTAVVSARVTGGLTTDHVGQVSNAVIVGPSSQDIELTPCLKLSANTKPLPQILKQPSDIVLTLNSPSVLQVVVDAGEGVSYQWRRNGVDIPGAVQREYVLVATNEQLSNEGGSYDVVVSNANGKTTSQAATVTVKSGAGLAFTKQPVSQTVTAGSTATFAVTVSGASALTYQWRRDGVNVAGATQATYTTGPTVVSDTGSIYTVQVSSANGAITSDGAVLTVQPVAATTPPSITAQPLNVSVVVGATATFTVTASGSPTLTYQWLRNGQPIANATSAIYTTPASTPADSGASFSVIVTNSLGNVTSAAAVLTVGINAGYDLMRLVWDTPNLLVGGGAPFDTLVDENNVVVDPSVQYPVGSLTDSLNGGSLPAVGAVLPLNGTLSATFKDLRDSSDKVYDGYSGSSSVTYTVTTAVNPFVIDQNPVTGNAQVSSTNLHFVGSKLGDVIDIDYVVNGKVNLVLSGSSNGPGTDLVESQTMTLASGSSLSETASGLKAIYSSGSIVLDTVRSPIPGSSAPILVPAKSTVTYSTVQFTVNGVAYVANGSVQLVPGSGSAVTHEISVTQGGTKVGRIFDDAKGVHIDVDGKIYDLQ